ncbi:hypothetical protein LEP3755_51060 [Leptolyngbya sp. NIES-3755]|nr:hypothetical protein LEP3755_51060 [Leptolyngbya sp. NIES-3755]
MEDDKQLGNACFSSGASFQANGDARFVSENVRNIGSQFQAKMTQMQNSPSHLSEGFAFEYLDAMDQQITLGGSQQVEVLGVTGKNSPDIQITSRKTSEVIRQQQQKRSARLADNAAKSRVYGEQEVRTPKGQTQKPTNPEVKESNVSASKVGEAAKNPAKAINEYKFKAAIAEVRNAAITGAITGAVASALLSGLEHFLAVERGEIEIDKAIAGVFLNTVQGAVFGGASAGGFTAITVSFPAVIPVLNVLSIPLMAVGAFQLVNQIGHLLDRHQFIKRSALREQIHQENAQFFEDFDNCISNYLGN